MKVTVIGEGSWGTAIASVLADNGHDVDLWCHEAEIVHTINEQHVNERYAPHIKLSARLHAHTDLKNAIAENRWIFISTPTQFFRAIVHQCKPYYRENQSWIILSKGIENDTLLLPSGILQQELNAQIACAAVSGPSFAHDVINKQLTGVMVAATHDETAYNTTLLLKNSYFLPFICNDLLGVQLGGALKNAVALLMGILHGMQVSANTRALFFTQAWQEMLVVAQACGAQPLTLLDLAGIGDLFLTATNQQSRNFHLGVMLSAGQKPAETFGQMACVPESINTVKSIGQIIAQFELQLPLFATLEQVLAAKAPASQLVQALVSSAGAPNQ